MPTPRAVRRAGGRGDVRRLRRRRRPRGAWLGRRRARIRNLLRLPLQPDESFNELLNLADVHLIVQEAGVADLVMPSKLTNMLASGRPVIVTAEAQTALAELVRGHDVGTVVEPGDPEALADAIDAMMTDDEGRRRQGANARTFAETSLTMDALLDAALARIREQWRYSSEHSVDCSWGPGGAEAGHWGVLGHWKRQCARKTIRLAGPARRRRPTRWHHWFRRRARSRAPRVLCDAAPARVAARFSLDMRHPSCVALETTLPVNGPLAASLVRSRDAADEFVLAFAPEDAHYAVSATRRLICDDMDFRVMPESMGCVYHSCAASAGRRCPWCAIRHGAAAVLSHALEASHRYRRRGRGSSPACCHSWRSLRS